MFQLSLCFLTFVSLTLANVGDVCRASAGTGTCKQKSSCDTGFTVTGACPNDPDNVLCCVSSSCKSGSTTGTCLNKAPSSCSGQGAVFLPDLCPGPTGVQCCLVNLPCKDGASVGKCLDKSTSNCVGGAFKSGLCPGPAGIQCCLAGELEGPLPPPPPDKPTDAYVAYLRRLYLLAKQYGGDRNPNQLVMEWLRHVDYSDYQWNALIGDMDNGFIDYVKKAGVTMMDTYPDPEYPGLNCNIAHFGASLNGVFIKGVVSPLSDNNRADVAGWGGDWMTFYGEWRRDHDDNPDGGDYVRKYMVSLTHDSTFKMRDLVEDADAFNIGRQLIANPSLNIADLVKENLATGYRTRMQRFVNGRFAGIAQEIAKNELLPGDDLIINAGRIYLTRKTGGLFSKTPNMLSDEEMNSFTAGFAQKMEDVKLEEVRKYPP